MSKNFDDEIEWEDDDDSKAVAKSLGRGTRKAAAERNKATGTGNAAPAVGPPALETIPDPYEPTGDGELTTTDRANLEACQAGVRLLDTAHWIAGKALDTIATARLFRQMPHRDHPERCYETIEEFALTEFDMSRSQCTKLRAAWPVAQALAKKGVHAPESQVREIVPVARQYGTDAAVILYGYVADVTDRVTAAALREAVSVLPVDLADDEEGVHQALKEAAAGEIQPKQLPGKTTTLPAQLGRDVDRRAITLADELNRGRIARAEIVRQCLEAFTDPEDRTVFDAVRKRLQTAPPPA